MSTIVQKTFTSMKWIRWLTEEIPVDDTQASRQLLITELVKHGIRPLFMRYGYAFACNDTRIGECVARTLYYKSGGRRYDILNYDYRNEDKDHYYYMLDDDVWEEFWETWGCWSDVDENSQVNREKIRLCLWDLLNLEQSSPTEDVDEMLGLNDEEGGQSTAKVAIDPYLNDAANGYFNPV